ncbi:hypothetical protein [Salininema proteolyticum]|uniref:Lipoprotein n=1 Tax=Salininema proteolyticum TaxID=1607685 RepID=A0ABV8TTI4_9ACTN
MKKILRSLPVLSLLLAGCVSADGASEDRVMLSEIGSRLESTGAYTATYRLGDGSDLTVAVDASHARAAVVGEDSAEVWTGDEAESLPIWLKLQLHNTLPPQETVAAWLDKAALDSSAKIEFSDTTLAGELSDCVTVQGASESDVADFEVCVTVIGVVSSVEARTPQGRFDARLISYSDGVDDEWFTDLQVSSSV